MDFKAVFKLLIERFYRESIDFALIGGLALQSAGLTRATQDIDLLVLSKDSEKIKWIMFSQGYELIHESEDILNFVNNEVSLGRVDFLLAHRTYCLAMLENAQKREVLSGEFKIKVLRVEDLIGLKVQSSSNDPKRLLQDMADIRILIELHYLRLDISLLREYFSLFDREEEFDDIIEGLKNAK